MKSTSTLLAFLLLATSVFSQKKIKVLFIGDSYTSVNNLPLTVYNVAMAKGDTVIYDSNTPGGTTFQGHCANATTLTKIAQGGWDYVVLQAQSEEPSFPPSQVQTDTYPYAARLDSLIHAADSCTETVFYMTWGHQNGDPPNCAAYSQICTYTGMQDRLTQSYMEMGQLNHATVAPVGEAWRKIFNQPHPYDMYLSDSTHPSIFGTYLVASVFYEILFQKSVLTDSFVTAGIPDSDAVVLRQTAHSTVSDSLSKWLISGHIPVASFSQSIAGAQATFTSTSINGTSFAWNYGDGHTGSGASSSHTYTSSGRYLVTLSVTEKCKTSVYSDSVNVTVPSGIAEERNAFAKIYPEPVASVIQIDLNGNDAAGYELTFIDQLGQVSKHLKVNSNKASINVSDLPEGIYVLQIKAGATEFRYPLSILR